jgi:two-component system, NarL family, response regulator DevR
MGDIGEKTAVILDQHPLWVEALQQLLDRIGVEVVGKTSNAQEAISMVRERDPDVLVTELEFADGETDGLTSLRLAKQTKPSLVAVVLSSYEDARHIDEAFAAGASVYCVKRAGPEDMAAAIRQAFNRSLYFASGGAPMAADDVLEDGEPGLTKREREILTLVAEGHSNAQLAKMLWVTEQTVKFHLSNIYRKLEVSNRTEASRWAQLHGLLSSSASQSTLAAAV